MGDVKLLNIKLGSLGTPVKYQKKRKNDPAKIGVNGINLNLNKSAESRAVNY